jgi:aspartate carbamoyltransferase regulatory subunit
MTCFAGKFVAASDAGMVCHTVAGVMRCQAQQCTTQSRKALVTSVSVP